MKIAVTGALGHIGSKLIRKLPQLLELDEIVIVDDLLTQRYSSLFNLPTEVAYSFFEKNVLDKDIDILFKGIDVVIHLAAITDATNSFNNREDIERVNYGATDNISRVCADNGIKMIHLSSTSIYGTQNKQVDEFCSIDELKPQSPYAQTKLREEVLIQEKIEKNRLKAISLRFGTIFGVSPGIRFHTAVNKFCWQAVRGIPLTVWKTAYNQKRPYLALDDGINAIAFMIRNKRINGGIYNVVTRNLTVKDIVDEIKKHVDDVVLDFVETEIMNQLSYEVLNTALSKEGFFPEGSISGGIEETINLVKGCFSVKRKNFKKGVVDV